MSGVSFSRRVVRRWPQPSTPYRRGKILALKGIGGYHLVVDATDTAAVAELRRRKARDDKPFAVMVRDEAEAGRLCVLDGRALAALASPRKPIVLAPRQPGAGVADGVAPNLAELGLLLPYSPLHHLMLRAVGRPLVMTSGNISDEPIAHDDDDAVARLGPLVEGLLTHDRPIHIRCDDSVVRTSPGRVQVLRRSRGYAPEPLPLPFTAPGQVLAVGAELKSTVSVAKGAFVVPSHHIGDLEHLATHRSFLQAIDHLCDLYGVVPDVVAHDLHPEYRSTKLAAWTWICPAVGVQHHHAHVASCLVEHGREGPVLGLAFDGLGYGPDGTLWGGELLVADLAGYERSVISPRYRCLERRGGDQGAVAHGCGLAGVGGRPSSRRPCAAGRGGRDVREAVLDLAGARSACRTTSMGRLFDAVATLIGGRRRVSYEAQAAIELEALARAVAREEAPLYEATVEVPDSDGRAVLDPGPLLVPGWSDECARGVAPAARRGRISRGRSGGPAHPWPRRWPVPAASTPSLSPAACSRTCD